MKSELPEFSLEKMLDQIGECFTPETARRLLDVTADSKLQSRINDFADRHNEGQLSQQEEAEYRKYVSYGTFISILKSKARRVLEKSVSC